MKLSPRLSAVAAMVPAGSVVADIGTDHAYIPVFLIKSGKIQRAIASDIGKGPLSRATSTIKRHCLKDIIKTRLSNGLEVLRDNEADTVVIAGVGGTLIRDMLEKGVEFLVDIKRIVLQPMNAQEVVREWLLLNGYRIVDEALTMEKGNIYQVIAAIPGDEPICDPFYYEIGKKLIEKKDPLLPCLLKKKEKEYRSIITGLEISNRAGIRERINEYADRLKKLQEVIEQCKDWHI